MKLSESIKPISYLKAHASELVRDIVSTHNPLIITQNGEAKVIIQDLESYEQMKESIALLKILSQSSQSKLDGKYKEAGQSFEDIKSRIEGAQ
ncbi:type II toxin-antitoxin system Phd/YefM family antitoxin [Myxococcota bacterium]|nr:type II toxin-antitoxin system Phd/YefM family antitoxin [Myxococcota bacterium]MBU1536295.1 type II toxin-antitoxin system Phd/YefM family antitoxin [Myxococcota bacterium]